MTYRAADIAGDGVGEDGTVAGPTLLALVLRQLLLRPPPDSPPPPRLHAIVRTQIEGPKENGTVSEREKGGRREENKRGWSGRKLAAAAACMQ